jgi:hypothetical protein
MADVDACDAVEPCEAMMGCLRRGYLGQDDMGTVV